MSTLLRRIEVSVKGVVYMAAVLVLLGVLMPQSAAAFFCNQSKVSVNWGKSAPYKIDGNGFAVGNFTVIDPGDQSIVAIDKMEITDALEAEFTFTGLRPGETQVQVRWEFTDQSDNGVCVVDVEVSEYPVTLSMAKSSILAYTLESGLSADFGAVFMPQQPFCPGETIASAEPDELSISLDKAAYVAYMDFGLDIRYGHPGKILTLDAENGDIESHDVNWWPVLNGTAYTPAFGSEEHIYGTPPSASFEENSETVSEPVVSTTPKEEVCAVLVSGTATNPRQVQAFETDVDFMKKNLMHESLGPQLTEGDISVLHNASKQEIQEKLESFKGKYRKVYFYYSGHGAERYMVTNDTVGNRMWYSDLADALEETGAEDICVIIDACHSGSAVEVFENDEGLKSANVTLLTSCAADTTSWTRYIITGGGDTVRTGEYTWAFVQCFGDPNADNDGTPGVSIVEAHDWLLRQNPTLDVGGTLRERMRPGRYVHRASPTTEREISHPDIGLRVDQGEEERFPAGSELRIDMRYDYAGQNTTTDPEVLYINSEKVWSVSLEPSLSLGYKVDMSFHYAFSEEEFTGQGEPGVVFRASADTSWTDLRPSDYDMESKTVTAYNIGRLGEFAVAEVKTQEPNAVATDISQAGFALQPNAPNPFAQGTQIRFSMEQAAAVALEIFDSFGRRLAASGTEYLEAGAHGWRWAARDAAGRELPVGMYYVRVEFTTGNRSVVLSRAITLLR